MSAASPSEANPDGGLSVVRGILSLSLGTGTRLRQTCVMSDSEWVVRAGEAGGRLGKDLGGAGGPRPRGPDVFAKGARPRSRLKAPFKRRETRRICLAVVYGHPEPPAGTWSNPLVWDEKALIQKETHPRDRDGTEAISDYRVLESFRDTSLIEVRLQTGRRNQIRLQARLRGHTLAGAPG